MKNKITHNITLSILLLGTLFISSCSHYYYAPNEGTVLALSEKNDVKFSYGSGLNPDNRKHRSFQVGYSPIKHLGLQSSYFSGSGEGTQNGILETGDGYIANAAIGFYYFKPVSTKVFKREKEETFLGMHRGFLFDLYAGKGKGTINNYYAPPSSSHFDFNKTWGQAGLHWQGRFIGFDLVFKLGVLDYKRARVYGKIEENHLLDVEHLINNNTYSFRESTMKLHFGIRHIRYFISHTALKTPNNPDVNFMDSVTHVGLMIELDELFRKRKKDKN